MTDLSIVLPSNRPNKLWRFVHSLQHLEGLDYEVCVVAQDPVTEEELKKWSQENSRFKYIIVPAIPKSEALPLNDWRAWGLEQCPDSRYNMLADCDFEFVSAGTHNLYTESSRHFYQECIDWLDENPDVGVLGCKSFFGSNHWGDAFVIEPNNKMMASAAGLILRNIGVEKIFPLSERGFVGTAEEDLIGFNVVMHGYHYAKRFCCPTRHEHNKKIGIDEWNPTYQKAIVNQNILGHIKKKFNHPNWDFMKKTYPNGLITMKYEAMNARKQMTEN